MSAVLEVQENLAAMMNGNSNGASNSGVTPHLTTVADYDKMIEHGILTENDHIELINGRIVNYMPKGTKHCSVNDSIVFFFFKLFGEQVIVRSQNPVILDDFSEPEPDIVIAKPPRQIYFERHPTPEDILLIIEISDSTIIYDRGEKNLAYAKNNIQHYILINLQNGTLEDYREPNTDGYGFKRTLRGGQSFNLVAFPETEINVNDILPTI